MKRRKRVLFRNTYEELQRQARRLRETLAEHVNGTALDQRERIRFEAVMAGLADFEGWLTGRVLESDIERHEKALEDLRLLLAVVQHPNGE